jgi:CubicO group peptidase (beta-lactamase class C family)
MNAAPAHAVRRLTRPRPATGCNAAVRVLVVPLLAFAAATAAQDGASQPGAARSPLDAATLQPILEATVEAMDDAVDGRRTAGLGMALLVDGEVRWRHATGWADRQAGVRLRTTTPIPVGELSRLVLAALAVQLAAEGRLDLDAPAAQYVDSPPIRSRFPEARAITVRDLLTHHAGLPYAQLRGLYRDAADPAEALPDAAWYLAQPTGSVQLVSQLGYERLGRVLEVAGGASLDALVAGRLATPLGLARFAYGPLPGMSRGHRKGRVEPQRVPRERAALGFTASLDDFARFAAALMPGGDAAGPLSGAARAEMVRVQNAEVALDVGNRAGLAWNLATSVRPGVGRVAVLVGAFPAHRAELRLALDHGLGVFAVANWDEADEVFFDLTGDTFDALLEARAGAPRRDRERPLPPRIGLPPGVQPAAPRPWYATPAGLIGTAPRGDGFELDFGGLRFRANPRDDGWYRIRYDLLGVIPIGFSRLNRVALAPATLDGEPVLLAFAGDRYLLAGTALAAAPVPDNLRRALGTYRLRNPDFLSEVAEIDEAVLTDADGILALGYSASFVVSVEPRLPLLGVGGDVFVVAGRGANQGEEVRIEAAADPPRIHYSGYVLERVDDD